MSANNGNNHNEGPNNPTPPVLNIDNSNNKLNNDFPLLQHSKNKKFTITDPSNINLCEKKLNNTNDYFNMKLKSILDKIHRERQENKKKLNINQHTTFKNVLDKQVNDISNNLAIVPRENITDKVGLDKLLADINKKYSFIQKDADRLFSSSKTTPYSFHSSFSKEQNRPLPRARAEEIHIHPRPYMPSIAPPPPPPKKKVIINREINGLEDLLRLIDDYPLKADIEYNINMAAIHKIRVPLEDLKNMIGMNNLKDAIVDQIIFFIQNLHKNKKIASNDFMHTVIYGPPGTGKTEIAKIMGRIFSGVGVLKRNKFKKATRVDLIAGYLGQTAIKTNDVINECLGGVLFIDEAYALGNDEKRDSFSKECIDTLCEALSNHKENLMVIIAGYEEDLKKCFFAYNKGLDSRFPWRFQTDDYTPKELNLIFQKKIADADWKIKTPLLDSWFSSKMKYFTFYGRDMETLFSKIKIAHSRRVFCKSEDEKTILIARDIDKGFEMFLKNNEVAARSNDKMQYMRDSLYL